MDISPEQQLRNLADITLKDSEVVREHNGKGKSKTYRAPADLISLHARTLAEAVIKYLDGELPTVTDECPF